MLKQGLTNILRSYSEIWDQNLLGQNWSPKNINLLTLISQILPTTSRKGGFGPTYYGYVDTQVAINKFYDASEQGYKEFQSEVLYKSGISDDLLISLLKVYKELQ